MILLEKPSAACVFLYGL